MERLVLNNVNLLDGVNPAVPGSTVIVADGRIESVRRGPAAVDADSPGNGETVVDLGGKTLMPGMILGHFHAAYIEVGATNAPFGLENPPAYSAIAAVRNMETALRCGFTGVVSAGSPCNIDPSLAKAVEDGLVNGPALVPCSRELSTTGHSNDWAPWWWRVAEVGVARLCDGAEEFRLAVREEIKQGAQMVKLYLTGGHGVLAPKEQIELTLEEFKAAVDTAHSRGARIRAHIANKKAIMMALEHGLDIIDHADGMDEECMTALVEANVPVVPAIRFPEVILQSLAEQGADDPGMRADLLESHEALAKAVAAGVRICLGDDYGAVGCYHGTYAAEMVAYVDKVGLSPLQVIKMATLDGAHLMGRGEEAGLIDTGRVADLVVVNGDPSSDISILTDTDRITAVLRSGAVKVGALAPSSSH